MPKWSLENTRAELAAWSDNPKIRRRVLIRRLVVAGVLVSFVAILGVGAKPAYRKFRNWRMDQQVEAAGSAATDGHWATARDLSKNVLMERRQDFEAFRTFARAQMELGDPNAYIFALQLLGHPDASAGERSLARKYLVEEAPQAIAFAVMLSLPPEKQNVAENRLLFAKLLNSRGMSREAIGLLENSGDLEGEAALRLEMIRALAGIPTYENIGRARELMAGMLEAGEPEALPALALLGNLPGAVTPGADLERLPEQVAAIDGAETIHHLHALHPQLERADEAGKEQIFQAAIGRFLTDDPGTLGTWLVRHGRHERVIDLLEEPAKTDGGAFVSRIHGFVRAGRHDEALKTFSEIPEGSDMVDINIARAVVERRRGNESAEKSAWNRALHDATFSTAKNRFIEIARHAALVGAEAAMIDAWVGAARFGSGPLPLSEDLTQVFKALGDQERTFELFAISRSIARFEPANPSLINNINYLGVLHNVIPAAAAVSALRELHAQHPSVAQVKASLVLALLAAGDGTAALPLVRELEGVEGVRPTIQRALLGTALVLAGEDEAGRAVLDEVSWSGVMRQEALQLREILVRSRVSDLPLPEFSPATVEEDPDSVPAWKKALRVIEESKDFEPLPPLPSPVPRGTPVLPDAAAPASEPAAALPAAN